MKKMLCPKCGQQMNKDGFIRSINRQSYECPDCGKKASAPKPINQNPQTIGDILCIIREKHGMSQDEVCGQLQRSRGWLSRIERGQRRLDIDTLYSLANIYKIRASDILIEYEKIIYLQI